MGFKSQTRRRRGRTFLVGLERGKHPRAWFSLGKKMKIEEDIWASFITFGYFFSLFMFSLIFMVVSFPLMD